MKEADEPIDSGMIARGDIGVTRRRGRILSPLTSCFLAITGFDALILFIASGVRSSGNDAAGNGMANAFQAAFVEAGALLVGIFALLFLMVRHPATRLSLTVLLGVVSLMLPMLLS